MISGTGPDLLTQLVKLGIIIFSLGAVLGFGLGACTVWVI